MTLPSELVAKLETECPEICERLQHLQLNVIAAGQPLPVDSLLREHLLHGVGRRLSVIRRSLLNIFLLFPPSTNQPLSEDVIADVQINLHAFVMNLYGLFDNWAWAFVLHHGLESAIANKQGIGLFAKPTQKFLPEPLKTYVTARQMVDWHKEYAKSFRDALAHRIPPYLPPAEFTPEDGIRYNALESEKVECIKRHEWDRLEQIYADQAQIGRPCFSFLHAFTEDEPPRLILLHPQLICDAMSVVEFGELFLQHWDQVAEHP